MAIGEKRIDQFSTDANVTGAEFLLLQDPTTLAYSKTPISTLPVTAATQTAINAKADTIHTHSGSISTTGIPNELPNGVRTLFTTPTAYTIGSLQVFLNGLKEGFITQTSTTTFTFDTAPITGDSITLVYNQP